MSKRRLRREHRAAILALGALVALWALVACAPRVAAEAPDVHHAHVPLTRADGAPLSPLALAGRDVFVREGGQICHTVSPEVPRSQVAVPEEELVPVPARGRAPDLAGVGGKYPPVWHVHHLRDPRTVSPGSLMPRFESVLDRPLSPGAAARVAALTGRLRGDASSPAPGPVDVPGMGAALAREAAELSAVIQAQGGKADAGTDLVAVIAYLQALDRVPPAVPLPPAVDPDVLDAALLDEAPARAAEGAALFATWCVACHGDRGQGLVGPSLTDETWIHGGRPSDVLRSIAAGHPEKGMPAWRAMAGDEALRSLAIHVIRGCAPTPAPPVVPVPRP